MPPKLYLLKAVAEGNFALIPVVFERELSAAIAERLVLIGGATKWLLSDAGREVLSAASA